MREPFKNTEVEEISDWEILEIHEFADVTKLAGFEFTENFEYVEEGEIIALRALNAKNGKLDLRDIKRIRKENSEKLVRSKLYKNDIVFTYVGTIGEVAIIKEDDKFHLAPNIAKITIREEKNPDYLFHYLRSPYIKAEIQRMLTTTSQPALSMGNIRKMKIISPPLPEQQKIADILSTVDEKIELIDQQIAETEALKKGLMQRLLTKGIGHSEFKDSPLGKIPKSWEVRKLGDISEVITKGTTPTTNGFSYVNEGINFVKVESITPSGEFLPEMFAKVEEKCHQSFKRSQLKESDILFSIAGALGRTAIVNIEMLPANTNQALAIIRLVNGLHIPFYYYFLQSEFITQLINKINVASAQPNLSLGQLRKLNIPFPSLAEQELIGNILRTIENKYYVQRDKKIEYQKLKKGLMQQLLTGKIRVNTLVEA